jgi:hypothetical protein
VRLRLILVARRRHHDRVGLLAYPCEDCRNTVPIYYCDACRGKYENDTTDQKLIAHFEAMEQFVSNRTIMRITEEIATKCDVLDLIIEEFWRPNPLRPLIFLTSRSGMLKVLSPSREGTWSCTGASAIGPSGTRQPRGVVCPIPELQW